MIDDLLRSVAAALMAPGWLLFAYASARRLSGEADFLVRWVATAAALAWLQLVVFHLLSLAGIFSIGPAACVSAVLAGSGLLLLGGLRGAREALAQERSFAFRAWRLASRSPHRYWVLAFAVLAAPGLLRAVILPPLGWDSLTYHAVKAGMWVQGSGTDSMIGPGTWAYYRNMLGGGEVLTAWAMLPMHADTLVGCLEAAQWLALGLAVMLLVRRIGVREPFSSCAAGFVLSIPTVRLILGSGYVELGLLFALVGGVALALAAFRGRPRLLAASAAALGVAAATKLPAIPVSLGLLLIGVGRAVVGGRRGGRVSALAGVLAFAAALGPFLFLTYQRTGTLFAPFAIRIGDLVLGSAPPEVEWYLDRPIPAPSALAAEARSLAQVFQLPTTRSEALGALALIPLGVAVFRARHVTRRNPFAALLIGVVIAVSAVGYFSPGFAPIRYRWSDSSSRFLLPIVVLAVVASVAGSDPRSAGWRRYGLVLRATALLMLALHSVRGFSPASLLGIAAVVAGLAVLLAAMRLASRARGGAVLGLSLVAAAVFGLGVLRDALRQDFIGMDIALHVTPRYWAKALPAVDARGVNRRIAVTSGPWQDLDNWFVYPFMGRRLQNRVLYVPVSPDGTVEPFRSGTTLDGMARSADYEAWIDRLRQHDVTDIMSFKPASLELLWMDRHPERFERLAGLDGYWGLYRVRGGASSPM